ncbi:MAG: hypothetical protein IPN29_08660 [Saprospiraceae bacterium]|nr:hypothetical protein [Saprospiraceae bacterium]
MKCIFATLYFLFINLALLKGQELYKFLNFAFQKENDVEIGQANYLAQFGYGIGASDSIVFKELQVNLGYINLAGARKNLTASLDFVLKKSILEVREFHPS